MLFYFEVFGSYYQLYKLANNRDKLVNTFCVIHENRRANVVERAKGVYYIKPGINFPGLVLIRVFYPVNKANAIRFFFAVYERFVHLELNPAKQSVYAAFHFRHTGFYQVGYYYFAALYFGAFLRQFCGFPVCAFRWLL